MRVLLAFIILISNSEAAWALCFEPSAPEAPGSLFRPDKPSAPYCVNTVTNTHTCDDWEIEAYKAELEQYRWEVNDYIRKLQNYISEAETFYNEVVDYAKCESSSLD
jgi:hypothetical protein